MNSFQQLQQDLANARKRGDRRSEGNALGNLGNLAWDQKKQQEARGYYDQALIAFRAAGDRLSEGMILESLSKTALLLSGVVEARRYLGQALAIYESIGAQRQVQAAREMLEVFGRLR
jgi:hypothetical protein